MAGIDKTYVNKEQWELAVSFLHDTRMKQIKELGERISLYHTGYPRGEKRVVLWNTSIHQDVWLKKNCPLDFIQKRLVEQYNDSLDIWAKKCKFDLPGLYFVQIKTDKDNVYFFDTDLDGNQVIFDKYDELMVYGTTRIHNVIASAIEKMAWGSGDFVGEMTVLYYGCELKFEDGIWTCDGEEVDAWVLEGLEPELPWVRINPRLDNIKRPGNVFISDDVEGVHPLTEWDSYPKKSDDIGQWIKHRIAPNHLTRFIR